MVLCLLMELFLVIILCGMIKSEMFWLLFGVFLIWVSIRWMMFFDMLCLLVEMKILVLEIL